MTTRRRLSLALAALMALALFPTSALAITGDEVIAKLDAAITRADDSSLTYKMVNKEKGKDARTMRMNVWVKKDKRKSEFLSPPDMKGTKALVVSRTQMYIYLPAFKKVRRIASHMTEGGFLGTTFSNEDMSTARYADAWMGALTSETAEAWSITLTPKTDETSYGKMEMVISKKTHHPTLIKYFDKSGTHTKTETRKDYHCEGDLCAAKEHQMTDHTRNGAWTKLILEKSAFNTGLSDTVFSKRSLTR